jgi:predicted benzoate:H+ symporter BenE
MKKKLIPTWKKTLKYAWSIRFAVLAGLFSASEVVLAYFPNALPRGTMAGLAGISSFGALVSRFLMQRNMRDE